MATIETYDWISTASGSIFNLCNAINPVQKAGFSRFGTTEAVYPAAVHRTTLFHMMEVQMTDYRPIENHIRHAQLQSSAVIGELIATAIVAAWNAMDRAAAQLIGKAHQLAKPPKEYSTALPRHF